MYTVQLNINVNFNASVTTVHEHVYQSVCWKALCASRALIVLLFCV